MNNKALVAIVGILIALGLVAGGFYYGKSQNLKQQAPPNTISQTPSPAQSSQITPPTQIQNQADFVNPSATIYSAEESVKAKDYSGLDQYMTDQVSVILAASECCGLLSKQKTLEQLKYLNQAVVPWDFSDTNPIAKKLVTADPANFKNRIIGTASNGFTVSFNLNNKFLIDKIFMASDYRLIAP